MKAKIESNYHTHTFLCKHAIGDVEDYVKRAIQLGYHTIAITDHGPFTKELQKKLASRRMSIEQYDEIYLDHLQRARNNYKGEIKVLFGVEIEYMEELKPLYEKFKKELDLLVLGQHYIFVNGKYNGKYISIFDHPLTEDEIEIYTNTVVKGLETGLFKILAHPEIFAWNIKDWDKKCEEVSKKIIASAIKNNVVLEINVNGIRNSYYQDKVFYQNGEINFPYPRREFWLLAKQMNARIIINDDAHAPNRIQDKYTLAIYEEAEKIGINVLTKIDEL